MNFVDIVAERVMESREYDDIHDVIRASGYDKVNGLFNILAPPAPPTKKKKKKTKPQPCDEKLRIAPSQPGGRIVLLGADRDAVYRHELESDRKKEGLIRPSLKDALLFGEQFPNIHEEIGGRGVVFFLSFEEAINWSSVIFHPMIRIDKSKRELTLAQMSDPFGGLRYVYAYRRKG